MLHITFSKYDCIIVHKAYYLFTCTCVSINSFHSHKEEHREHNYRIQKNTKATESIIESIKMTPVVMKMRSLIMMNIKSIKEFTKNIKEPIRV